MSFIPRSGTAMVVDNRFPRKSVVKNLSLRMLWITVSEDCSPFLDSLMFPALKEFEFEVDFVDNDDDDEGPVLTIPLAQSHKAILDLLTRSNCKLDRVGLRHCGFSPSAILRCFEHNSLETIEALRIVNVHDQFIVNDEVLVRLTILSPSHILLPKLTRLELDMCVAASSGKLGRMVFSRRFLAGKHGVERLQYFSVTGQEIRRADKGLIYRAVLDGLEAEIPDTKSDEVDSRRALASLFAYVQLTYTHLSC